MVRLVILATALVGCINQPLDSIDDNPPLGTGDLSIRTTMPGGYESSQHWAIASVWAQPFFAISYGDSPFDDSDARGGFDIVYSSDTMSPGPATCSDRSDFAESAPGLTIQTERKGTPHLTTGDMPFIFGVNVDLLPQYAQLSFDSIAFDTGHVTITASDDDHIAGSFDGTGDSYESLHVVGYFDVPICWN